MMAIFTPFRWAVCARIRWVVVCRSKRVRPQLGQATNSAFEIARARALEDVVGKARGARRVGLRLDREEVAHPVAQEAAGQETRVEQAREEAVVAAHGGAGRVPDPERREDRRLAQGLGDPPVGADRMVGSPRGEAGVGDKEPLVARRLQGRGQGLGGVGADVGREEGAGPAGQGGPLGKRSASPAPKARRRTRGTAGARTLSRSAAERPGAASRTRNAGAASAAR